MGFFCEQQGTMGYPAGYPYHRWGWRSCPTHVAAGLAEVHCRKGDFNGEAFCKIIFWTMYFELFWYLLIFCCSWKLPTDGDCSCWRKLWKLVDTAKKVSNGEVHSIGADLQTQDVSGGTGIAHQVLRQASPGESKLGNFEVILLMDEILHQLIGSLSR